MVLKKTSLSTTLFGSGSGTQTQTATADVPTAQEEHSNEHTLVHPTPADTPAGTRAHSLADLPLEEKFGQSKGKGKNDSLEEGDSKIILVDFDEGDPENPKNWSKGRKWLTTFLLNVMTLTIGLSTTAYSSGIDGMVEDLGVSTELGQLGLFMFNARYVRIG